MARFTQLCWRRLAADHFKNKMPLERSQLNLLKWLIIIFEWNASRSFRITYSAFQNLDLFFFILILNLKHNNLIEHARCLVNLLYEGSKVLQRLQTYTFGRKYQQILFRSSLNTIQSELYMIHNCAVERFTP